MVPPNYAETFAADLVLSKSAAGFFFLGPAQITMGTFKITMAAGIHGAFIDGQVPMGIFGATKGVVFTTTTTTTAMAFGSSSADTVDLLLRNFAVDMSGAGAAAVGVRVNRVVNYWRADNLVFNGAGGANTQEGMILDGTGNDTGEGLIINCQFGGLFKGIEFGSNANNNVMTGGFITSVVAGGKAIDISGGGGNFIQNVDVSNAATGVNFGNSALVFANFAVIYGQGNTTDFVFGAAATGNTVYNIGANNTSVIVSVVDSGTNNHVINPYVEHPFFVPASNYTNATTTFSTVTNMSFPVIANHKYQLSCNLYFNGSAGTAGPKFQLTGPAAPTTVVLSVDGATNTNAYANGVVGGFSTPVAVLGTLGAAATNFVAHVTAGIDNGANAGTVALQAAANGAGTLSIIAPSSCTFQ